MSDGAAQIYQATFVGGVVRRKSTTSFFIEDQNPRENRIKVWFRTACIMQMIRSDEPKFSNSDKQSQLVALRL
jgi:hypothetical protein